ncbi:stage III sporulation protein AG [Hominifimenecus sp. rT4P-3]|uniref:stage III sporulation protein AG n=1 Tax=Hominifimenecus sp. rT4P-3 TaxID=3242979 RepID=UPI003DA217A4
MNFLEMWKNKRPGKSFKEWGRMEKLMLLLASGLLLVVISWPTGKKEETPVENQPSSESATRLSYEEQLERRLTRILSQVDGAGEVQVMVTLKDGGEKVLQENISRTDKQVEEADSNGGMRSQTEHSSASDTLLVGGSGGNGSPYVVQERVPEVEGVLVLAEGAEKATVKTEITEAVQALFPIEVHKIRVLKRGS